MKVLISGKRRIQYGLCMHYTVYCGTLSFIWLLESTVLELKPCAYIYMRTHTGIKENSPQKNLPPNINCFDYIGCRMNPYGCIATGREEGMIEIVTNSMTISKIQRWYKKGAFAKEALYEWLKFKNPKEER